MTAPTPTPDTRWKGGVLLAALPAEGECMMLDALVEATGLPRERLTRLITALKRNGFVSQVAFCCYRRTPAGDGGLCRDPGT